MVDDLKSLRIEREKPARAIPRWLAPAVAAAALAALALLAWKELAPREFRLLARDDSFDRGLWYPETLDHFAIEHEHAAGRELSHGELLVPGDPELAHDEDVQRGAEARRDLVSDRDPAPGQGERHDVPPARISPQRVGKNAPGMPPISIASHVGLPLAASK